MASVDRYCYRDSGDVRANNNIISTLSGRPCRTAVTARLKDGKREVGGDQRSKGGEKGRRV